MGGFGRKGLEPGVVAAGGAGSVPGFGGRAIQQQAPLPDDGLSDAARAFLAAERARNPEAERPADPAAAMASASRFAPKSGSADRSLAIAYILWWFCGPLAAHRFYLGAFRSAWAMIGLFWGGLVIGGLMSKQSTLWIGDVAVPPPGIMMIIIAMIWILIDAFLIPGLRRKWREKNRNAEIGTVLA